jgi:hypothetical protein
MPRARLAVTLPPSSPLGRVTRAHPDAHVSVHTAVPNVDASGVTANASLRAPELPAFVAALDAADGATLDVLARDAERVRCRLRLADATALRAVASAGVPPAFPFPMADGTLRWDVTAPGSALSALPDALEATGLEFDVTSVSPSGEPSLLTPRQRRTLDAAVRGGYFETPRGCSLETVAAEVGVAKSTCSETLRRAEAAVLSRYLETGTVPGGTA